MKTKFAKVLDSDLKRKRAARFGSYLSGFSCSAVPHLSTLKTSSIKLGKRKKPDVCETKCRNCELASFRTKVRCYPNFMKSGLPKRLMFYQRGQWIDHESDVVSIVRKEFELRKAAVEINTNDNHMILDFTRMLQFNFRHSAEQPVAWIDEEGTCFFPEVFPDADNQLGICHHKLPKDEHSSLSPGMQEINLQIEIDVSGVAGSKLVECCGESSPLVKRVKVGPIAEVEDSFDKVSDVRMKEDVGGNQGLEKVLNAEVDKDCMGLDSDAVKEMFLNSLNLKRDVDVVKIFSNSGFLWQGRLELFLKQVELTKKLRGNSNVQYAWLACSKEASSGIMTYGLGHYGFQQIKSGYGIGVHLSAANCAETSVNKCDVDKNGVRHLVLCRVVMGNMEVVHPGSKQFHPSSQNFDSGVDDILNPRHYVVWSLNINTHIYPEYVVSYKVPANCEGSVLKNGDINVPGVKSSVKLSNVGAVLDNGSDHQSTLTCDGSKERTASLNSTSLRTPKSPWMPFPVLLSAISKQVPPSEMKKVNAHYEQFRTKMMTREDFIKNLRLIVGDALLRSAIMELNHKLSVSGIKKLMATPKQEIEG